MEFPSEPPARAACPLKANVLIEVRYHRPLGGLSTPPPTLAWKAETATLPGSAAGTSHAGVGPGEDISRVPGRDVPYPRYCRHPAWQPARAQEVCTGPASYLVPALVLAQGSYRYAPSCDTKR